MNYSVSEENYVKTIYHLQQRDSLVSTNELAHALHTRAASVTDMLKKLKQKKLLHYEPYRGFRLTPEGKKAALSIIRRHRLWEYFLAEKLGFSWEEVHAVAEELEHVRSRQLIEKLDAFLGYPRIDPHGDPIPDPQLKMEQGHQLPLVDLDLHHRGVVCQIGNQSTGMLEFLKQKNISIGTRLEVKRKFFDDSLEIKVGRQPSFTISDQLAQHIYVTHG